MSLECIKPLDLKPHVSEATRKDLEAQLERLRTDLSQAGGASEDMRRRLRDAKEDIVTAGSVLAPQRVSLRIAKNIPKHSRRDPRRSAAAKLWKGACVSLCLVQIPTRFLRGLCSILCATSDDSCQNSGLCSIPLRYFLRILLAIPAE